MGTLDVLSLAERPDLAARMWSVRGGWPTFMVQSPIAVTRYERATEMFPDLHLVAPDDDEVVARVHAVPVRWPGTGVLPQRGWDWALESGVDGALAPVLVDTAQDHAVYIEPNIWVQHALSR